MALPRPPESALARNTLWMLASQVGRIGVQAAYFIIIARTLGRDGYGAFVGATALIAIASPFASLGTGNLMIRAVARDPARFPGYWARALLTTLLAGSALVLLSVGAGRLLLPASVTLALLLLCAVSDLLFFRITELAAQAFQAHERLSRTAQLQFVPVLLRLIAVAGMALTVPAPTPTDWAWLFLATGVISAGWGVLLVTRELGGRFAPGPLPREDLREGLHFAVGLSAQNVYNDVDKTMLARLSTVGAVGIYAAAYRIVDVFFAPVRALLYATYARFFRHGESGVRGSLAFARRLLPIGMAYGMAAAAAMYLGAPLLPLVLGDDYGEVVVALRWLAAIPLLRVVHYLAADTLTGAGLQGVRSAAQVAVAGLNVVLNLFLIPRYGWRGAAWASLACELALVAALSLAVRRVSRREGRIRRPLPVPEAV